MKITQYVYAGKRNEENPTEYLGDLTGVIDDDEMVGDQADFVKFKVHRIMMTSFYLHLLSRARYVACTNHV